MAQDPTAQGRKSHPQSVALEDDFSMLPDSLVRQCRKLIDSYHTLHGYAHLPDILYRCHLGPFIERSEPLRELFLKAARSRSAKKSNDGFATIASIILALEILTSGFAGWDAVFPEAATKAQALLKRNALSTRSPLMQVYVYPSNHLAQTVVAVLSPAHAQNEKVRGG